MKPIKIYITVPSKDTTIVNYIHNEVSYKTEAFILLALLAIFIIIYAIKKPIENMQKTIHVSNPMPPQSISLNASSIRGYNKDVVFYDDAQDLPKEPSVTVPNIDMSKLGEININNESVK